MPTKKSYALPAEVAEKYKLQHPWYGAAKQFFGRYGSVDITTLTLARANSLYAKGWRKIQLKPVVAEKPAPAPKDKKE